MSGATGWRCPGCNACYAPHVDECKRCAPALPFGSPFKVEPIVIPNPPWYIPTTWPDYYPLDEWFPVPTVTSGSITIPPSTSVGPVC